ncbi:MAG: AroM family protein [Armatimonadetes bacterium]|nr:AroM family protein [Armatimonadota bacterium]
MTTLGLITIGQTPRVDLTGEFRELLPDVRIEEAGALDGLTRPEIDALRPRHGQFLLVTRLEEGEEIAVAKEAILERLQRCIERLEPRADFLVLMCTGKFPPFQHRRLLLLPHEIVNPVVAGLVPRGRLGIIVPHETQIPWAREEFTRPGVEVIAGAASPYGAEGGLAAEARAMAEAGAALIYLNCFGMGLRWKRVVREAAGCPVISPVGTVCRVIDELRK